MKKVYVLFLALAVFAATSATAQEVVRLTRYEGTRITGVSASNAFKVTLVKSDQTKAVVEIDADAESFLKLQQSADGRISVGIDIPRSEQRRWNNGQNRIKTMNLTLYLSELDYVSLSGVAKLTTEDTFTAHEFQVKVSGSSQLTKLDVQASSIKFNGSGASKATITTGVSDVEVIVSGSAVLNLNSSGGSYAKINASGASVTKIMGGYTRMEAVISGSAKAELALQDGEHAHIKASGAAITTVKGSVQEGIIESFGSAQVRGEQLQIDTATLKAGGAGTIHVQVNQSIDANAAGSGKIQYTGTPGNIQTNTSGAGSVRRSS